MMKMPNIKIAVIFLSLFCSRVSAALPVIASFTANSRTVTSGMSVTLNCSVTGTTTDIELDDGAGVFTPTNSACSGGIAKSPTKTTLYKLVAGNNTGTDGQVWAFQRIFVGAGNLAATVTNCAGAVQNSTSCVITVSVGGTYADPYEDVVCDVTFTSPSAATIRRTSYWDPVAAIWKINFRPIESGAHTWSGYCGANPSGGTNNYTAVSGSFTSIASSARGYLALYTGAPYLLKTMGDGRVFYPIGLQSGWAFNATFGWQTFLPMTHDAPNSDTIFPASPDQWFGTYSAAGTNFFRTDNNPNVWLTTYCSASGQNVYDTNITTALDTLVQKADSYGVKIQMMPFVDPNSGAPVKLPSYNFFTDLKTSSCFLKVWLESIARYDDRVDIWELLNESVPNTQYMKTLSLFVRTYDPYGHLLTLQDLTAQGNVVDINSKHIYWGNTIDPTIPQTLDSDMVSTINSMKSQYPNRPIFLGETGDGTGSIGCIPDADPPANERWRDMLWVSFFNRFSVMAWNSFHGDGTGCPNAITNLFVGTTQRAQQLVFSNLIRGFDPLATATTVTLGNLGSNTARVYALSETSSLGVYITHANNHSTTVTGATATLTVPSAGLTATWYDPFDGSILGTSTPGSGSQVLTIPPFSKDILLKISGTTQAQSSCDLNSDGAVNVLDVQSAINQVLGIVPCTTADLQHSGQCTVVDVQRVINAALGSVCVSN